MISLLDTPRSIVRLPPEARKILAAAGINQLGAVMQGFLVIYLVHSGFAPDAAATAAGAFAIGTLAGAPIGAWATGRLGPRTAMAGALAASGVLVALVPAAAGTGEPLVACALALVTGLTTQAFRPPSSEALSRVVPEQDAAVAFSAFRVAMNLGALLAPLLAGPAIAAGRWDVLFAMDAATCLAAAALVATAAIGRDEDPGTDAHAPDEGPASVFRELFTVRRCLYLVAMATSGFVYCHTYSVLPLQLEAAAQPPELYAAVLSLGAATLVLLELPVTAATRRWPVPATVLAGTLVFGLSYGLYAVPESGPLVIAGAALGVAGTTISAPRLWSHPSSSPARMRPAFFAASQAAFGAGMAIGPVVGVVAWENGGTSWWLVVMLVGAISAIAGGLGTRGEGTRA